MSIVTLDWPRIETETPTGSLAARRTAGGREAVFRSALENYIADYQRHLAKMAAERDRGGASSDGAFLLGSPSGCGDSSAPFPVGPGALPMERPSVGGFLLEPYLWRSALTNR